MGLTELKMFGYLILPILGLSYLAIVGVAIFHPDKERRKEAQRVLRLHRLTRQPRNERRSKN